MSTMTLPTGLADQCYVFEFVPDGTIDTDDYAEFETRLTGPQ